MCLDDRRRASCLMAVSAGAPVNVTEPLVMTGRASFSDSERAHSEVLFFYCVQATRS